MFRLHLVMWIVYSKVAIGFGVAAAAAAAAAVVVGLDPTPFNSLDVTAMSCSIFVSNKKFPLFYLRDETCNRRWRTLLSWRSSTRRTSRCST